MKHHHNQTYLVANISMIWEKRYKSNDGVQKLTHNLVWNLFQPSPFSNSIFSKSKLFREVQTPLFLLSGNNNNHYWNKILSFEKYLLPYAELIRKWNIVPREKEFWSFKVKQKVSLFNVKTLTHKHAMSEDKFFERLLLW